MSKKNSDQPGRPRARLIECLQWYRGRLRGYRPTRGALQVADYLDHADRGDQQQPIIVVAR